MQTTCIQIPLNSAIPSRIYAHVRTGTVTLSRMEWLKRSILKSTRKTGRVFRVSPTPELVAQVPLIQMHTVLNYEKLCDYKEKPVPVAARSKAYVCGRSPPEIVGSNPTGGMDVCLL